jgi:hypothetical protein
MSLKAARARPRRSNAKATASTDVRKTSAKIQTLESSRNFGGTLCDSKTALLPPLGYGSYMPVGCVLRMTWQFGSQLTKTGVGVLKKSGFLKTAKISGIENVYPRRERCLLGFAYVADRDAAATAYTRADETPAHVSEIGTLHIPTKANLVS